MIIYLLYVLIFQLFPSFSSFFPGVPKNLFFIISLGLKNFLQPIFKERSASNKFYFFSLDNVSIFILEGQFCQIQNSQVTLFFFQPYKYIILSLLVFEAFTENSLIILLRILVHEELLFSYSFQDSHFGDESLIIMYLGVGFFGFILLRVHYDSWTCKFMVFLKFGKLSVIISSNNLFASFSFLSLSTFWNFHNGYIA